MSLVTPIAHRKPVIPVRDADGNVVRHGCGHLFPAEEFRHHWHACPACHRPDPLDPSTYVDLVLEPESFQEIYTNLTLEHIDGWTELYDYTAMRQKSARQPAGNEALVIGHGRMFDDIPVALAVSNFAYMGGSMGAVVGEKFRAIVHFALAHHLPLLAITATGGARMQEGTVALVQMAKTTAAVVALRRAGLPYIAVLGHPTLGGVLASYATLADFIIAEEKATLSFALTFRTPRMAIHVFSQGHFSHAQQTPTVVCCHRMRGDTPNAFASGVWYGSRSTTIEAYQVQHLPIVKAYADKIGLVEAINQLVPTEMAIDPGTIVLGMILDTLSGRSPLYRLEEFFTHQDTALLLGKAVPPEAFQDDTVGRVLERLYATGTMKVFTACAVRADRVFGFDKRYVHFDTTSITVYGDYLPPEESWGAGGALSDYLWL